MSTAVDVSTLYLNQRSLNVDMLADSTALLPQPKGNAPLVPAISAKHGKTAGAGATSIADLGSHDAAAPDQRPRPSVDRPIIKLSVDLLGTMKAINKRYYAEKKQRAQDSAMRKNNGHDSKDHHFVFEKSEKLNDRYDIDCVIGKGSFGRVVKAYDHHDKEDVAIKIVKGKAAFHAQAQIEIAILQALQHGTDKWNIVKVKDTFMHYNHQCIVFELLPMSLFDLLEHTNFVGVSISMIQQFGKSLLATLGFLAAGHGKERKAVIHCDLKPENILVRNPNKGSIAVIDFGSACFSNQKIYTYIQSRFYRAPEVLLGLKYGTAIDMWSLGCVLIEMHTGKPLFGGRNEAEQIVKQVELLGVPPEVMITKSRKGQKYFRQLESKVWVLKSDYKTERTSTLREILKEKWKPTMQYFRFVNLVSLMLDYNPTTRIRPRQARQHPFFFPTCDESLITEEQYLVNEKQIADDSIAASASASSKSIDGAGTAAVASAGAGAFSTSASLSVRSDFAGTQQRPTAAMDQSEDVASSEATGLPALAAPAACSFGERLHENKRMVTASSSSNVQLGSTVSASLAVADVISTGVALSTESSDAEMILSPGTRVVDLCTIPGGAHAIAQMDVALSPVAGAGVASIASASVSASSTSTEKPLRTAQPAAAAGGSFASQHARGRRRSTRPPGPAVVLRSRTQSSSQHHKSENGQQPMVLEDEEHDLSNAAGAGLSLSFAPSAASSQAHNDRRVGRHSQR